MEAQLEIGSFSPVRYARILLSHVLPAWKRGLEQFRSEIDSGSLMTRYNFLFSYSTLQTLGHATAQYMATSVINRSKICIPVSVTPVSDSA